MSEMVADRAPGASGQDAGPVSSLARSAGDLVAGYHGGEEMPLASYFTLVVLYWGMSAGFWGAIRLRSGAPQKLTAGDVLLLGVATHKLSRLVTQDWVTSPFRAPFTEYGGGAGAGEVKETPRGTGMQRALGELFT